MAQRILNRVVSGLICSIFLALASHSSFANPPTAVVSLSTLYENERDWPYQVALTSAWRPAGHEGDFGWGAGTLGVLLRVDAEHRLRVDFGRFGIQWVPAEATDVVDRANKIRTGALEKTSPNLAVALNHRLLDPSGKTLAPWRDDLFVVPGQVYLLVFADPADSRFAEIARETAAWVKIPGAVLVLISQRDHPDAHVYKYCYDAGWRGAFLMDKFTAPYSQGYLEPDAPVPAVQVMSPEGRLLFESAWSKDLSPRIARAAAESSARSGKFEPSVSKP